jgi:DNA mismatch repair protein MutS2
MQFMVLSALPGVGDRLAKKITDHFGDEQAALDSLRCGDIARIAEIDGVSPKRALSLARLVAGDSRSFLATKEAERLHKEILNHIQNYASAPATRQRMQLLMPVEDSSQRRQKSIDAMTFAAKHPQRMNQIATILKGLGQTHHSGERYERVVVSKKPMDSLKKWCRVLQPGEGETWKDYTVFKRVTWIGGGAPADAPEGWVVLGANPMPEMILPERTIAWFKNNQRTLSTLVAIVEDAHLGDEEDDFLHEIHAAVSELGRLPEWLNSIDEQGDLELIADVKDRLWKIVKSLESEVNQEVTKAMDSAKMNLSGSELLEALSDGSAFQRKLQNATSVVITDAMEVAKQRLAEELDGTGVRVPYSIFTKDWPAKVDRKVVDELDTALSNKLATGESEHMLKLARNLGPLQPHCEQAVRNLIELDQWVAVARWAMDNQCTMPELADHGIHIEAGRHLLLGVEPDAVTYGLGKCAKKVDQQSLALLTGANSGGKTTLLELLAHTCILAHMGLPVPARHAVVGQVQALHILAKAGGTQSAGALEQTLVELANVVSDPTPKLILADELEAITEPGAGARIIAGMLLAAEAQEDTTMMLVTHLAPSIIKATGRTDLRVDGIEATGLDADLELMVDRTPKRNHLARSTPELIVKRLVERSEGHAQALFRDILTMFQ